MPSYTSWDSDPESTQSNMERYHKTADSWVWLMLWRGQLIYRTDFSQLKWLFHIINQQPCLPCKANKWRNKFSPHFKHVLQLLYGSSMVLQECVFQGLSGLGCRSKIHAIQLGCSQLPFSWCQLQPGPDSEILCGQQQWEHPWACLVPSARVKWGTSFPSGGSLGDREAGTATSQTQCFSGHEQSCLQGGAEIGVQFHEYFLLLKGVIFSVSLASYSLNHWNQMFVWVF